MKKRIFLLVALIVLVGAAALVAIYRSRTSPEAIRHALQKKFAAALRGRLEMADASYAHGGQIDVEQPAVFPPERDEAVLECERMKLLVKSTRLVGGERVVRRADLVRPRLTLRYDAKTGRWNLQELLPVAPPEEPAPPGTLSEGLRVHDGSISLSCPGILPDDKPRMLGGVNLEARPWLADAGIWNVRGGLWRGAFRGVNVDGTFRTGGEGGFSFRLSTDDFKIDPVLLKEIPLGARLDELFEPRGRVSARATLSAQKTIEGLDYTAELRLGRMTSRPQWFPAQVSDVAGRILISDGKVTFRNITGVIGPEALEVSPKAYLPAHVRVDGTYLMDPEAVTLRIEAVGVPICRRSLRGIPESGDEIFELLKPSGKADLSLRVRDVTRGETRFTASVRLNALEIAPADLPCPIREIAGGLEIDEKGIRYDNIQGLIPQDGRPGVMVLNGTSDLDVMEPHLRIGVRDVKVTERLVRWIPEVGEDLWETFAPTGNVEGTIVLHGDKRGNIDPSGTLRLSDVTISPGTGKLLPGKLENVRGHIDFDSDGVRFQDVRGTLKQKGKPAHVTVNGKAGFEGEEIGLEIGLRNVEVTEALVKWLPDFGPELWELLTPRGHVEGLLIVKRARGEERLQTSGSLRIFDGQAQAEFLPLPLTNMVASIRFDGDRVHIDSLEGNVDMERLGAPKATTNGAIDLRGDLDLAKEKAAIEFAVSNLNLSREVVEAVPTIGKVIWDTAEPEGVVGLSGNIRYDGSRENSLSYFVDIQLKNTAATWKRFPARVSSMTGRVVLTENLALIPFLTGVLATGRFNASGLASLHEESGTLRYSGAFEFSRVDLRRIVHELNDKDSSVRGLLSGRVELGGRSDGESRFDGVGSMELSAGHIWTAPVFLNTLNVLHLSSPTRTGTFDRGRMHFSLSNETLSVQAIEIYSDTVELTGSGKVSLADGSLDLFMVAATLPEGGIPIIGKAVKLVMRPVEKELIKLRITGTISDPKIEHKAWSPLKGPVRSVYDLVTSPFGGGDAEGEDKKGKKKRKNPE